MADKTLLDREEQAGRGKRRIAGGAGRPGGAPGDSHVSLLINGALPTEPLASYLPGVTSSQLVTNVVHVTGPVYTCQKDGDCH